MVTVTYNLEELPSEFTDYIFDEIAAFEETPELGGICRQLTERTNIDDGCVVVRDTAIGVALQRLYEEKHGNVEMEIVDGERDDYNIMDLISIREDLLQATVLDTSYTVDANNDVLNSSVHDTICDNITEYLTSGIDKEWFELDHDNQTVTVRTLLPEVILQKQEELLESA